MGSFVLSLEYSRVWRDKDTRRSSLDNEDEELTLIDSEKVNGLYFLVCELLIKANKNTRTRTADHSEAEYENAKPGK